MLLTSDPGLSARCFRLRIVHHVWCWCEERQCLRGQETRVLFLATSVIPRRPYNLGPLVSGLIWRRPWSSVAGRDQASGGFRARRVPDAGPALAASVPRLSWATWAPAAPGSCLSPLPDLRLPSSPVP